MIEATIFELTGIEPTPGAKERNIPEAGATLFNKLLPIASINFVAMHSNPSNFA